VQGQDTAAAKAVPTEAGRDRREVVRVVFEAEAGRARGRPVRTTATREAVPASSVYRWLANKEAIDAPASERDFYISPDGLAALHRILTAVHLVFVQTGGCGVDRVCQFLEQSRLDRFIAASHGNQHALDARMEALLGDYAREQRERLGATMAPRTIVVCEDETFHPAICLVAIDAESGLILVECYSERRDAASWTAALDAALDGLPVKVVRVVGDEAKGLIAHAREGLGVEHGADLFHVQHDLSKATSLPLAARLERPAQCLANAEADTQDWRDAAAAYLRGPRAPGRPMDYDRRIAEAQAAEDLVRADYDAVVADQANVRAAIRELGDAYHPVHLVTGALQTADGVRERFAAAFTTIDDVATRARLPTRCRERIDKARRVLPKLVAGIVFFHGQLDRALAELDLAPAVLDVVRKQLVPGLYLARAARRARSAAERAAIVALSDTLLAQVHAASSPFMALDEVTRRRVEDVVQGCLALFVRSSACVEGRNGHLARYHHGLHRLSKRRLRALTAIHNFYARRPDHTTAAERFFGQKPDDLFDWLLERLDPPPQPRAKRLRIAA
jgi:hypothetical protein